MEIASEVVLTGVDDADVEGAFDVAVDVAVPVAAVPVVWWRRSGLLSRKMSREMW